MPIYAKYSGMIGSVGVVWPLLAPLGTAAAPSYSFAIDPNTGMFSSGPDTLNFSTGGVERIQINSSGWVGVGTTSPSVLLNLSSDTTTTQFIDSYNSTGASANLTFRTARGTAAAPTATQLDDELGFVGARGYASNGFSSGGRAAISFRAAEAFTPSAQGSYITFATAPTGSLARVERVRISSGGAVGINAPTPVTMLDINGDISSVASRAGATLSTFVDTANGSIVLQRKARGTIASPTAVQSGDLISYWVGRGYGATAWSGDRAAMVFRASENWTDAAQGSSIAFNTTAVGTTSTTERMRIASTGNVGINVTSPSQRLAVDGEIYFTSATGNSTNGNVRVIGTSQNQASYFEHYGSGTSVVYGRVASGTLASPTATANGVDCLRLSAQGYDGVSAFKQIATIGLQSVGATSTTSSGGRIIFSTVQNTTTTLTERMRLDDAGNLGVGISSPSARLHVQSDFGGVNDALIINNGITSATAGRGSRIAFTGTGNTTIASIESQTSTTSNTEGSLFLKAIGASGIQSFTTNGSERMRIIPSGDVGIGTVFAAGTLNVTTALHIVRDGNLATTRIESYNTSSANSLQFVRARGTAAAPANLNANDGIGGIYALGYGGGITSAVAGIELVASQNFSSTAQGTYITLSTTLDGTTTRLERLRITNSGEVRFNGSTSGYVGLQSPAAPTSYTMTLPTAQGAAGSYLQNNGSGTLTWRASNYGISSSSGTFTTTSTTYVAVTNLSVTITTNGRPVMLMVQADGTANILTIGSNSDGITGIGSRIWFSFVRGTTRLGEQYIWQNDYLTGVAQTGRNYSAPCSLLDAVAAGTYTYTVEIKTSTNQTGECSNAKLVAYEI